ncbi:MAG: hypothetical protein K2W85_12810 [Phycisphaerales bacterium]|nr:hypothetical protein [Phycisphaerales bacterium]
MKKTAEDARTRAIARDAPKPASDPPSVTPSGDPAEMCTRVWMHGCGWTAGDGKNFRMAREQAEASGRRTLPRKAAMAHTPKG